MAYIIMEINKSSTEMILGRKTIRERGRCGF
jgi:hypothetical protein